MPAIQLPPLLKGKGVSGTVRFLFTINSWGGSILFWRLHYLTQVWSCNVPIIFKMFSQQVISLVAVLTLFLHGVQYVHCSASPKCSLISYFCAHHIVLEPISISSHTLLKSNMKNAFHSEWHSCQTPLGPSWRQTHSFLSQLPRRSNQMP